MRKGTLAFILAAVAGCASLDKRKEVMITPRAKELIYSMSDHTPLEEELKKFSEKYDADGDRILNYNEAKAGLKNQLGRIKNYSGN